MNKTENIFNEVINGISIERINKMSNYELNQVMRVLNSIKFVLSQDLFYKMSDDLVLRIKLKFIIDSINYYTSRLVRCVLLESTIKENYGEDYSNDRSLSLLERIKYVYHTGFITLSADTIFDGIDADRVRHKELKEQQIYKTMTFVNVISLIGIKNALSEHFSSSIWKQFNELMEFHKEMSKIICIDVLGQDFIDWSFTEIESTQDKKIIDKCVGSGLFVYNNLIAIDPYGDNCLKEVLRYINQAIVCDYSKIYGKYGHCSYEKLQELA